MNQHTGRRLSSRFRFRERHARRIGRDSFHRRKHGEKLRNRSLNSRGGAKRGNLERHSSDIMRIRAIDDWICPSAVIVNIGSMRHVPVNYGTECEHAARMQMKQW